MNTTFTRLVFAAALVAPLLMALPAAAAKPTSNNAGAQKYGWHLSGAVMPVPPYGSLDIPGSDTASKLIVNQPNGKVLANMTGVMNGLHPNTEYTVYLSNVYTPYVFNGWDTTGSWNVSFSCATGCPVGPYVHSMTLAQNGSGAITGSGGYPAGGPFVYAWTIDTASVSSNTVNLTAHYTASADAVTPLTVMNMVGTIAPDGSMSGTWTDNYQGGSRAGTWSTTSGQAIKNYTGSAGWPGLLTPSVQPFTFTTNSFGSGSWHVNLKTGDITLPTSFSAWINEAGYTVLISDPVQLGS